MYHASCDVMSLEGIVSWHFCERKKHYSISAWQLDPEKNTQFRAHTLGPTCAPGHRPSSQPRHTWQFKSKIDPKFSSEFIAFDCVRLRWIKLNNIYIFILGIFYCFKSSHMSTIKSEARITKNWIWHLRPNGIIPFCFCLRILLAARERTHARARITYRMPHLKRYPIRLNGRMDGWMDINTHICFHIFCLSFAFYCRDDDETERH